MTTPANPMIDISDAPLKSLQRRLRFASNWLYGTHAALMRLGVKSPPGLGYVHAGGNLAFDLVELLRARGRLSNPGRPERAALSASGRLPQQLRYRSYWYDAATHSLVGRHLGLDLHRHHGKYYVLECNVAPALRPERRRLYRSNLDPFISEIALAAKARGFERVVFYKRRWPKHLVEEFERASGESGIDVIGASSPLVGQGTRNPLVALPERLAAKTAYVLCGRPSWTTPICHFMHDKLWSAKWLRDTIESDGERPAHLTYVPTYDHLVLPAESADPRWPNLVVKLADKDKGEYVAMGRFRTEEEARRGLQLRADDRGGVPGIFELGWRERIVRRFFPRALTIYQPFIPPEVVENRARIIRLHVFVSPLFNAFLSSHAVVGGEELPDRLEGGLVKDDGAFTCNFSMGGRYITVEPQVEEELRLVAAEFGRIANLAITRKFQTAP